MEIFSKTIMTKEDYSPYINFAIAAFEDGLDKAANSLAEIIARNIEVEKAIKQKRQLPPEVVVNEDYLWVYSEEKHKCSFLWFCELFDLDPITVRSRLHQMAKRKYLNTKNKPKPFR